ncbi:MAG: hypothetical protein KDH09_04420 [Chrysiogenetes bacterium]|nr:hypothetical protein [Chrysiogenetes bacterium]
MRLICPDSRGETLLARLLAAVAPDERPALEAAACFASRVHAPEIDPREGPYILHPLRVALIVAEEAGLREPLWLKVALLHDTQEHDPALPTATLAAVAGSEAARWSAALAFEHRRNPGVPQAVSLAHYFAGLRAGPPELRIVKMADRLDNLREAARLGKKKKLAKRLRQERRDYLPIWDCTDAEAALALKPRIGFFLEEQLRSALPPA